jgi:hypothetical protein
MPPPLPWILSWLVSRRSPASVDLVGATPLLGKRPLEEFHHLRWLRPLRMKSPAGCWRSRPFGQSWPLWPNTVVIPGTSAGRWFCPWPTQIVIPTTLAPETGKVSLVSMGFGGFYSSPKLTRVRRSPRILRPSRRSSVLRLSLAKCHRPSRDVLVPGLNRLATASSPLADVRLLGTCSLRVWTHAATGLKRCNVTSHRLDFYSHHNNFLL